MVKQHKGRNEYAVQQIAFPFKNLHIS